MRVTIVYDHRLIDGGTVAGFLEQLETILHHEMSDELRLHCERSAVDARQEPRDLAPRSSSWTSDVITKELQRR